MSSDPIIQVTGLSKRYRLWKSPSARLKAPLLAAAAEWMQRRGPLAEALWRKAHTYFEDFYALREVSFTVNRGEVIGLIGRNGSGKSTLLQILAGTLQPSQGAVQVNGRVSAILELGTGFNPELTGRENVRMAATLQGLTGQAAERMTARVAEFAGIGQFFDQPVRNYSSGMFVRLAFAASIGVEPEILIVDEALAVGDTAFQSRCYRAMQDIRNRGATILFVSHDIFTVQSFCDRVVLLDAGQMERIGPAKEVVHRYIELLTTREQAEFANSPLNQPTITSASDATEYRFGKRSAEIVEFALLNAQGTATQVLEAGALTSVRIRVLFREAVAQPIVGFTITTPTGIIVTGTNTWYEHREPGPQTAGTELTVEFLQPLALTAGKYLLNVAVAEHAADMVEQLDCRNDVQVFTVISTKTQFSGFMDIRPEVRFTPKPSGEQHV